MSWEPEPSWSQSLAALGVPGLFVIAFFDSAAVPIVGGPEGLTMLLAWRHPAQVPWIVLAGALGATLGGFVFYRIGRVGGDLALSRLKPRTEAWVRRQVTRHAFWALLVCVVLPPPFPSKPLALAAGVVRTPPAVFFTAVLIGRLLRYSALAYVGFRFGDQAARIIRDHYPTMLVVLAGAVLLGLLSRRLLRPSLRG